MKRPALVIIGLGLMGGSLALAVRKRMPSVDVVGVSRSQRKLDRARRLRMIHRGSRSLAKALDGARAVCLATPVFTLKRLLRAVDAAARPGTLVFDMGSTKHELVSWADRARFRSISFVGCHPLTGSHESGLEAARADLYEQARVFLVPTRATQRGSLTCLKRFWKRLNARPLAVDSQDHDLLCAYVSHLPHLAASALVRVALPRAGGKRGCVGPGFLDSTRVAGSPSGLWAEIFQSNRKLLLQALADFRNELARAERLIALKNWKGLTRFLKRASHLRARLRGPGGR